VQVKEGAWYDQRDVDKTTAALNDALGSLGYAFVDVQNRSTAIRRRRPSTSPLESTGPKV